MTLQIPFTYCVIPRDCPGDFKMYEITGQPRDPRRKYDNDAGFDLYTSRDIWLWPFSHADIHTDIRVALPPGFWGRITGRSSSVRRGLLVSEGIIDTGYRGELYFGVLNLRPWPRKVKAGERLAQLILHNHPCERVEWYYVKPNELSSSERGGKGFGSTGR